MTEPAKRRQSDDVQDVPEDVPDDTRGDKAIAINEDSILDEIFADMMEMPADDVERLRRDHAESLTHKTLDQVAFEEGRLSLIERDTVYRKFLRRRVDEFRRMLVGARVGSYQVLEEIAAGGMGIVFRARQESPMFTRDVAIKFLLAGSEARDEEKERFVNEARQLARLAHPNLVSIFDSGIDGQLYYFAMELVDGQSLSRIVADEGLPWRRAVEIVRDVAKALEFLHENGIVHRDIKPNNILVDGQGTAKVLDFGVSLFSGDPRRRGIQAGTPHYMAPELIDSSGSFGPVGPGADIYALGCVLYYCLFRREVFHDAVDISSVFAHTLSSSPRFPPSRRREPLAQVERIVARCLEKRVDDRFRSASELVTALESVLHPSSRRHWLAVAGALVVVTVLAFFVIKNRDDEARAWNVDLSAAESLVAEVEPFEGEYREFAARLRELRELTGKARADGEATLKRDVQSFWTDAVSSASKAAENARLRVEDVESHSGESLLLFKNGLERLGQGRALDPGPRAHALFVLSKKFFQSAAKEARAHQARVDEQSERNRQAWIALEAARRDRDEIDSAALRWSPEARELLREAGGAIGEAESLLESGGFTEATKRSNAARESLREIVKTAAAAERAFRALEQPLKKDIESWRKRVESDIERFERSIPDAKSSVGARLDAAREALAEEKLGLAREQLDALETRWTELERTLDSISKRAASAKAVAARARGEIVELLEKNGVLRLPSSETVTSGWKSAESAFASASAALGSGEYGTARAGFEASSADYGRVLTVARALVAEMVWIPGGAFGQHDVAGFWIDRYEISVARYAEFLAFIEKSGHGRCCGDGRANHTPDRWQDQKRRPGNPVVGVTLAKARAYARWCGKRLPLTEEWQLGARRTRGGVVLAYPYGARFDEHRTHSPLHARLSTLAVTTSHASGASAAGCHHMSGNAAEWVLDADGNAYLAGGSIAVRDPDYLRSVSLIRVRDDLDGRPLAFAGFRCVLTAVEVRTR